MRPTEKLDIEKQCFFNTDADIIRHCAKRTGQSIKLLNRVYLVQGIETGTDSSVEEYRVLKLCQRKAHKSVSTKHETCCTPVTKNPHHGGRNSLKGRLRVSCTRSKIAAPLTCRPGPRAPSAPP